MKTIFFALFLPFFLIAQSNAQITLGEAAYLVGRQQVLAQQIARAHMAVELKMEVQSYRILITDGINLYNNHLKLLESFYANKEVSLAMDNMNEAWDEFYRELIDAPQKEEVIELIKLSYDLLLKADKVLAEMEVYAKNSSELGVDKNALKLLRLAEYQNALSQHAILYYLAHWNGVLVSDFFSAMHKVISEYEANFYDLTTAADDIPELKEKIMANAYEWNGIAKLITNVKGELRKDELRKVLSSADLLFRDANAVARAYKILVDAGVANSDD